MYIRRGAVRRAQAAGAKAYAPTAPLALVQALKEDVSEMKKREAQNEKLMWVQQGALLPKRAPMGRGL